MLTTIVQILFAAAVGVSSRAPVAPSLGEVHFAFDSARLPDHASQRLERVVRYANAHRDARIVLDAHTDPIGTDPYNVRLAIRRARSVQSALTSSGVPDDQIVFAIYGEDGAQRASYAADRRVTVWPTRAPLARVIRRTFAHDGTAVTWQPPLTTAQIAVQWLPIATR